MPAALTLNDQINVRSCVPGRVRWHVPGLLDQVERCQLLCRDLAKHPAVREVTINSRTATVLVLHERSTVSSELASLLKSGLVRHPRKSQRALLLDSRLHTSSGSPTKLVSDTPKPAPASGERGLIPLLKQHRSMAAKALGIVFVDRMFEASPPALIGLAVDTVTRKEASSVARLGIKSVPQQLQALTIGGSIIWTADSLVGYFRSNATARLSNDIRLQLQNDLYRHFQTLDLAQIEAEVPGYWASVFRDDVERVSRYFEQGLDPLVSIVANALIVFTQLLRTSPAMALLQLAVIPAMYIMSRALLPAMYQRRLLASKAESRLNAQLESDVQGISTIASFVREDYEAKRIEDLGARAAGLRELASKLSATYVPLLQMIVGVGFLGTLGLGGLLVHRNRIQAGQLSTMSFSSLRLLAALGQVGFSVEQYQRAQASMRRIDDFRSRVPRIASGQDRLVASKVRGEIKLDKVTFGYGDDPPVFEDLSLEFPAGKMIGIVGLSGSGKSTLLKLLLRYYDVGSGTISLDGHNIQDVKTDDLRKSIGYVPQQPFIFPGTVRENIAYGYPEATHAEVAAAAKLARADGFIEALPLGYDTMVRNTGTGGEGQALSGGQAQRIAIARTALADTPIILLDEATSAVDNETEAALQQSLNEHLSGKTMVIVAHRLSTIRHADWIYVLNEKSVREQGTHDTLVAQGGLYAAFWKVQTGDRQINGSAKATPLDHAVEAPQSEAVWSETVLTETAVAVPEVVEEEPAPSVESLAQAQEIVPAPKPRASLASAAKKKPAKKAGEPTKATPLDHAAEEVVPSQAVLTETVEPVSEVVQEKPVPPAESFEQAQEIVPVPRPKAFTASAKKEKPASRSTKTTPLHPAVKEPQSEAVLWKEPVPAAQSLERPQKVVPAPKPKGSIASGAKKKPAKKAGSRKTGPSKPPSSRR